MVHLELALHEADEDTESGMLTRSTVFHPRQEQRTWEIAEPVPTFVFEPGSRAAQCSGQPCLSVVMPLARSRCLPPESPTFNKLTRLFDNTKNQNHCMQNGLSRDAIVLENHRGLVQVDTYGVWTKI